nr:MAG TPA: tail fiber protein [Caudoviricetes sp.]
MPDFQYQPPTGPLSGSEFERQTTRFFQQVQGAAAQSTAIVAQTTANEALERAQASNLVDGKTTTDAGGVITVKDVAIGGDLEDLVSVRGIFDTLTKGSVDCNTLTEQGVYAISLVGTVNGPGFSAKLIVFNEKNSKFTNQMALAAGAGTSGAVRVAYRAKNSEDIWSPWSEGILSGRIGDGITVNNGIISVPEYEGATASAAGTSGLVPPAAAGQADYVLCGDGEWRDIKTLVAAAQARLADKAAS